MRDTSCVSYMFLLLPFVILSICALLSSDNTSLTCFYTVFSQPLHDTVALVCAQFLSSTDNLNQFVVTD